MKVLLQRWVGIAACAVFVGCGGGSLSGNAVNAGGGTTPSASAQPAAGSTTLAGSPGAEAAASAEDMAKRLSALQSAAIPLPTGPASTLNSGAITTAVQSAQAQSGSRGAFEDFHRNVAPLLPSPTLASTLGAPASGTAKALALASEQKQIFCVDANGNIVLNANDPMACQLLVLPPVFPPPENCPVVCATSCAQADANAFALAFAHASATACAWAQAWACVYNGVFPFNRVCAWAQGQACFTAFVSAFGAGWDSNSQRKCRKECSDGLAWEWLEVPVNNGNN